MTFLRSVPSWALAMVLIPSGSYVPLFRASSKASRNQHVGAFLLDRYPVTIARYLSFLRTHPRWRRSRIPRIFSDRSYLQEWKSDLNPGPGLNPNAPVTEVSWFAASSYCRRQDQSLPTLDQWEYAASPEAYGPGLTKAQARQKILQWESRSVPRPTPPVGSTFANRWGAYDLHGLVWEWTLDFDSMSINADSREGGSIDRGTFCAAGSLGASTFTDYAAFLRYGFRGSLNARSTGRSLGFRCAKKILSGGNEK